jgi:hypothetical protein
VRKLKRTSKTGYQTLSRKGSSFRDARKKSSKNIITTSPKSEFILRIHALKLFPYKYPWGDIKKDMETIHRLDKKRRKSKSDNTISKSRDMIEKLINKKYNVHIFGSGFSRTEWEELMVYSLYYELENWYKDGDPTFKRAKRIVLGRIRVNLIWWKGKKGISPYDKYLKESQYVYNFLRDLSEDEYNRRIKQLVD